MIYSTGEGRGGLALEWGAILWLGLVLSAGAQDAPYERVFPQTKPTVEKVLKQLQSSAGGRLPVLDGFALPGDRPLERFKRGYYQCRVEVSTAESSGSVVRVTAKITAWYSDPAGTKSGYQVLASNGRLETDFLDRLQEALQSQAATAASPILRPKAVKPKSQTDAGAPVISAPAPQSPAPAQPIMPSQTATAPSPFKLGATGKDVPGSVTARRTVADNRVEELTKEAKNLEEILRSQSHPDNLLAIKQSGTPVFASPSEGAKVTFLTTAEDEFEILDTNTNWVHIRISGLSRGWVRRSSVEMPESLGQEVEKLPAQPTTPAAPQGENKASFQVANEQIASFPGQWEPLRGKTVKIVSIEKNNERASDTGSKAKLEFAKSLFDREYTKLTKSADAVAGLVLVFDFADGGMMATPLPVLQQWKAGSLSDEAFWRRCYFDPPGMFPSPSGQ